MYHQRNLSPRPLLLLGPLRTLVLRAHPSPTAQTTIDTFTSSKDLEGCEPHILIVTGAAPSKNKQVTIDRPNESRLSQRCYLKILETPKTMSQQNDFAISSLNSTKTISQHISTHQF